MTASDVQPALERFIAENDDLLALESRIGRFNIFDALGLSRTEIRHSNFLAFILDPAESHGQGQVFLKALIMDLLKNAPLESRPMSPIEIDGTDLRGVEIRREWNRIDLLITCKEPAFAVVIENKIGSTEHSNQLARYKQTVAQKYPRLRSLFVFLTPDGEDASEDTWLPYSYGDIHRVLERARNSNKNAIGADVGVFLDHYLNLLGSHFMNEPALDELCQRIYKNHRIALDLIWERVGASGASALAEALSVLEHDRRWHLFSRSRKSCDFVPGEWLKWLPPLGSSRNQQSWITVHLRLNETKLVCLILVGPMSIDSRKRGEIVDGLRKEIAALGLKSSKAKEVKGAWSRLTSRLSILEWEEDEEPDADTVRSAVTNQLDELYPRLEKLGAKLKTLCDGVQ